MVTEPAATPVTTPEAETAATAVLEDDHVPPGVASVMLVVEPIQTDADPPIGATVGCALTMTESVELLVQPLAFDTE